MYDPATLVCPCGSTERVIRIGGNHGDLCVTCGRERFGVVGAIVAGWNPPADDAYALWEAGLWTGFDEDGDEYTCNRSATQDFG